MLRDLVKERIIVLEVGYYKFRLVMGQGSVKLWVIALLETLKGSGY